MIVRRSTLASTRVQGMLWLLLGVWTASVGGSLWWNCYRFSGRARRMAGLAAQVALEHEALYLGWCGRQGGVLVPVSPNTPPNPLLNLPGGGATTAAGTVLTLVNPAYLARLVRGMTGVQGGSLVHLASLRLPAAEKVPDVWESNALSALAQGCTEVQSVEPTPAGESLRLMRPLITERGCLRCHAAQGYQEGAADSGLSVSVPLAAFRALDQPMIRRLTTAHIGLWIVGLVGISLSRRSLGGAIRTCERVSADLASEVVERRRLTADLRQSCARLDLLAETAGGLLGSESPQGVLDAMCRKVLRLLDCEVFVNYLTDEPTNRLRLNTCAGLSEREMTSLEWCVSGEGVCGCVWRDARPVVVEDVSSTSDPRASRIRALGLQAYVCHPLLAQGRCLGTLSFGTRRRSAFHDEEVALMRTVADQAAMAILRKRSEEGLRALNLQLEQRVAERTVQLTAAANYARSLIEASLDPMMTIATDGRIADLNRAAELVTGLPRSAIVGSDFTSHFTEPAAALAGHRQALAQGMVRDFPLTFRHVSGRTTDILCNATVYRNEVGGVAGVFAAARDITERQETERERQLLREELARISRVTTAGQLAASLAHELGQPLAAIVCNVQAVENLFAQERPDHTQVAAALRDIAADSQRAGNLIHQIRSMYQRTGGTWTRLQLNEVLQQTEDLVRGECRLKGVICEFHLESPLPLVQGNKIEVQQVLLNLVTNALEAMAGLPADARRLRICTRREGPEAVGVSVQDSGTGLSEEQMRRVFDPFYTTKANGMGMGLTICHSIIEAYAGRLWAENNPGGGVTFHFTLGARPNPEP